MVEAVSTDPRSAAVVEKQRVLIDFSIKLTAAPHSVEQTDIDRLRAQGLTDHGVHDVAAIIAYFNFVNRIASGLGVELEAEYQSKGGHSGS